MGHSQYWQFIDSVKPNESKEIERLTTILIEDGENKEVIENLAQSYRYIYFNGVKELIYEDFYIDFNVRNKRNWCKTALRPYDKYVVACLLMIKSVVNEKIKLETDADYKELEAGIDLFNKLYKKEGLNLINDTNYLEYYT